MMHISFAWTVGALLKGEKTVTRRCWKAVHASRFHKGDLVAALDKDYRAGGKKVAIIRLTADPYRQPLREMTKADLVAEGNLWAGLKHFRSGFPCRTPYVIEFELVEVLR